MLPFSIIEGGSFTSASSKQQQITLHAVPDLFWLRDRTGWGNAAAVTSVESWWRNGMAAGAAQASDQAVTTNILSSNVMTSGGFTFINSEVPPTFAALTATAITGSAGTFVVSMASTANIFVGDYVRIYASTGELQIAGYTFQVTAVSTNVSITLGYMASSGITFAADATAAKVIKYYPNLMYPRRAYIANITQATQAVVYFTATNDFTPGEWITFIVPAHFGMTQLNEVSARVLSVTNSATVSSVTMDLDTTGFSAFAFPTSAQAAAGISPAIAVPDASGIVPLNGSATIPQSPPGTNLLDAFDNRNKYYMNIGTGVITNSGHVFDWVSYKFDLFTAQ